MTAWLWLLLGAFFVFMGGLIYAYLRIARWAQRERDEAIASLPRLITYGYGPGEVPPPRD